MPSEKLYNFHYPLEKFLFHHSFQQVANKYNVIIGVREPNPASITLLREGNPSKNFHMKAKSSITGPTAGFITEEARYSKCQPVYYQQHNDYIKKAKQEGALAVDLIISKNRIIELITNQHLYYADGERYIAYYHGQPEIFFIDKYGKVLDTHGNPVKVMTNPPEKGQHHINKMPVTADYDLFTIIPRENQSYNIRPRVLVPRLLRGQFSLEFMQPKLCGPGKEDVNMGNIHVFAMVIINSLNKEIANEGYQGGKLIWHGEETGNPYSRGFDENDRPIFFLPNKQAYQVRSKSHLQYFYSILKSIGFSPEYNPAFGF
ncbi:anthrax toxin-like adenylyl cyclase domain-containing protein [Enterobacteriaceae bacterium LUAb1]